MIITLGFSFPAKADYIVWQDPATGLSLSWPDTWKQVSNADPDDIITLMAPSGRAHATCRARARKDSRTLIYPPEYSADIQKINYSTSYWEQYLGEYSDYKIYNISDGAGLGRGFSGHTIAGFQSAVQGPEMSRKALIFASLYNGTAYIIECSSHKDAFANWQNAFLSIAKSVDFKKAHHELRAGHYRNFMADPRIEFESEHGESRTLY
ncbi:MAG: hypothetical protein CO093_00115 [Alphaproteobacteria bacterium CG_4_9_14_3_um_filter_47_13]|nr:MAG: hypothetical protein CO093_00115 [Alphaproteobacteria bacterium CG_4_9_14_3_um_filter_47_13]